MALRDFLENNSSFTFENNVFYQKGFERSGSFEKSYIRLREKENRIYSDDQVKELPEIAGAHPLKKEWSVREHMLNLLLSHLKRRKTYDSILEIGCGNGWLVHRLVDSINAEVCGLDVNEKELLQGASLFKAYQNLSFIYGDIFTVNLEDQNFHTIILASSIQYFPNIRLLIKRLQGLLAKDGEIHIIDSPFYSSAKIRDARTRTLNYYTSLGMPIMASHYFHHSLEELSEFQLSLVYDPTSFPNLLKRQIMTLSPFPWIMIKK